MEKFKSERGSATVVTLTVVLFFTIILMGVYVSANNANRAQKNADTTIIDKYGEDVNFINEIYNEKKLNNVNLNSNSAKIKWNGKNIEYTSVSEAKATAQIDILDENVDLQNCEFVVNNNKNYMGVDDNIWLTADAIAVTEMSGTVQTTIKAEKTYYIHLLLTKKDNTKEEIISDAIKINNNEELLSTYKYEAIQTLSNNETSYNVTITINNKNSNYDNWKISFEVPEGFDSDNLTCSGTSKIEFNNNSIILYSSEENGKINKGDTIQIQCTLNYNSNVEFWVKNAKLNDEQLKII